MQRDKGTMVVVEVNMNVQAQMHINEQTGHRRVFRHSSKNWNTLL